MRLLNSDLMEAHLPSLSSVYLPLTISIQRHPSQGNSHKYMNYRPAQQT
jgi:hypothetical protein